MSQTSPTSRVWWEGSLKKIFFFFEGADIDTMSFFSFCIYLFFFEMRFFSTF